MKLCENKNLISAESISPEDENFLWSCGDQDVLNCLVYRNILDGKLNIFFPRFSFFYRVIKLERQKISVDYDTWTQMGWSIFNIFGTQGWNIFLDFSKQSPKFDDDNKPEIW
jgi:hypothetical protein